MDIAMLFLEVTNSVLHTFPDSFFLGDANDMYDADKFLNHCIDFIFDSNEKNFKLKGYNLKIRGESLIDHSDKEKYVAAIKLGFLAEKLFFNSTVEIDNDIFQQFNR